MDNQPKGYITLITVIAISAVGSLVALLILFSGVSTSKTSLSLQQSAQAKSAADGCAELALAAIQANIALSTPATANYSIDTSSESVCSYTITGVAPDYIIDASGTVDSDGKRIVRKVRVVLNRVGPTLNIYSWQELP